MMGTPMYDHSWKLQAAVEENNEPPVVHDRRSFIASICMASAATSLSFPRLVAADDTMDSAVNDKKDDDDDDDGSKYNAGTLELFGQDIGAAKWPHTTSPLPKPRSPSPDAPAGMSDLQKALEQAQKKRNVGPLTHG